MLIEIFERVNKRDRSKMIKVARLKCDACQCEFTRDVSRFDLSKKHSCSNPCRMKGTSPTSEQRERIKEKLIGIKRSPETRKKMSLNNACHRPEVKEKISRKRAIGIAEGRIQPFYRGYHGTYTSRKTGNDEKYHSLLELDRMILLDADDHVKSWTKHHGIVLSYIQDDRKRTYVPDFYIEMHDCIMIEEVKGWTGEKSLPAKMTSLETFCRTNAFVMSFKTTVDIDQELKKLNLSSSRKRDI